MKLDIDTILLIRLFAIKHTEYQTVYKRQLNETNILLDKIENDEIKFKEEDGYIYFYDAEEVITNVAKVIYLEEVEGFDGISYRENMKLYRWNFGSKSELIYRNRGVEEKMRLKFLPSGFYFVSNKIDEPGKNLYFVSQKLIKGDFTFHKTIGQRKGDTGTRYAFTERKNKGKIYRLVGYEHLLKDEEKQISPDHLILSAYKENNDTVFEKILRLYVPHGSTIADITYGLGKFWSKVPKGRYKLLSTDLVNGVDCRNLPYSNHSLDCVVFDPPYVSVSFSNNSVFSKKARYQKNYKLEQSRENIFSTTEKGDHESLLDLYFQTSKEAFRVLKNRGIFIVKCQDEFVNGRQRITHCEILNELTKHDFRIEDIFVVVRKNRPTMRDLHQRHARKNHSYFLVFRKVAGRKKRT